MLWLFAGEIAQGSRVVAIVLLIVSANCEAVLPGSGP